MLDVKPYSAIFALEKKKPAPVSDRTLDLKNSRFAVRILSTAFSRWLLLPCFAPHRFLLPGFYLLHGPASRGIHNRNLLLPSEALDE
jgi:hypothetical protein